LTRLFFRLGNFAVGPNGRATLEQLLGQLTSDNQPILIVGSADPSGPEQLNETLSDARAQSVADWLVEHGIERARIQARGIGNTGAAGSAMDRRVDIWLGGSR
jgi:outer membrane protein OmpA-like peptidoglycan-associated protein